MSDFGVLLVSASSILVPFSAALFRYRHVTHRFKPLCFLLLAGVFNEIISYASARWLHSNQVNGNCYTLVEFMLLSWQFVQLDTEHRVAVRVAAVIGLLVWIADNCWLHSIYQANVLFRIISSLMIAYFSIDTATRLMLGGSADACQKTSLTLCLSFFVYHTYRSFILLFSFFAKHPYSIFSRRLWLTLGCINILIHFTYTLAIVWIPKQLSTSTRYS